MYQIDLQYIYLLQSRPWKYTLLQRLSFWNFKVRLIRWQISENYELYWCIEIQLIQFPATSELLEWLSNEPNHELKLHYMHPRKICEWILSYRYLIYSKVLLRDVIRIIHLRLEIKIKEFWFYFCNSNVIICVIDLSLHNIGVAILFFFLCSHIINCFIY